VKPQLLKTIFISIRHDKRTLSSIKSCMEKAR
jgi:hypothetical protein